MWRKIRETLYKALGIKPTPVTPQTFRAGLDRALEKIRATPKEIPLIYGILKEQLREQLTSPSKLATPGNAKTKAITNAAPHFKQILKERRARRLMAMLNDPYFYTQNKL